MRTSYAGEERFSYSDISAENRGGGREDETRDCLLGLRDAVKNFEREFIVMVLDRNSWHRGRTAADLGVGDKTLYRKMKQYCLS